MTRKRVLSVIETLGRGGAERLLVTQHQHLDKDRFEARVVALFEPVSLATELEACGVTVSGMSLSGPGRLPEGIVRLRSLIRRWRPHVVHTHLYYANIAGRLAAAGAAPVFTTLHNPDYGFEDSGRLRFKFKKWLDRQTGGRINRKLLAVSEHVKRDFERHLGFRDIEVLYNYVDIGSLQRSLAAIDRKAVRERLGVATDELLLLHVGRIHHQKGQDLLLQALGELSGQEIPWRAAFVGAGEDRALRQLASSLQIQDRVLWVGPVPDVQPLYAAADLFAFPSRYEAFGIALLEAMVAGLPAVVSEAEGLAEVATAATALSAPVGDVPALRAALDRLFSDAALRNVMGEAARARARHFDVAVHLPRLQRWYLDA